MAMTLSHGSYSGAPYGYGIHLNFVPALYRGGNGPNDGFGGDFDSISFRYEEAPILTQGQTVRLSVDLDFSLVASVVVVEE